MKIYVLGDSISIGYGPFLESYLKGMIEYSRKQGEEEALLNLDNPQGANGGDSSMVLSFLKSKAEAGGIDADLLLLNCGLHDIKTDPNVQERPSPCRGSERDITIGHFGVIAGNGSPRKSNAVTGEKQVPLERYRENLEAIVRTVESMTCSLVWIRTTPCDEAVHNKRCRDFHRFSADCIAYNTIADQIMVASGIPIIDLYSFTLNLGENLYSDHVHFPEHIKEKQAAFITGWLMAFTGKDSVLKRQ